VPFTIILAPDVTLKVNHENRLHVRVDPAIAIILVSLLPYYFLLGF
jgi:hypothetical protein